MKIFENNDVKVTGAISLCIALFAALCEFFFIILLSQIFTKSSVNLFMLDEVASYIILPIVLLLGAGKWIGNTLIVYKNQHLREKLINTLIEKYFSQNYDDFRAQNKSNFRNLLLSEVDTTISYVIIPFISIFMHLFLLLSLFLLLIFFLGIKSIVILIVITLVLLPILIWAKKFLRQFGDVRNLTGKSRFNTVGKIIENSKYIYIFRTIKSYSDKLHESNKSLSNAFTISHIFNTAPKFLFESVMICGVALAYFLKDSLDKLDGGLTEAEIAILVFAIYRALPSLQGLLTCYSNLQFGQASLSRLESHFSLTDEHSALRERKNKLIIHSSDLSQVRASVRFKDAALSSYDNGSLIIDSFNRSFKPGDIVLIKAPSGFGKSTFFDAILGLKSLDRGQITVNSTEVGTLDSTSRAEIFSYIPQSASFLTSSFDKEIKYYARDMSQRAFEAICCDFQLNHIEDRSLSFMNSGENLSGGQKQRVILAREVAKQASIYLLDESLSAVDKDTEKLVLASIIKYLSSSVIFIISHNPSTSNFCTHIIDLEEELNK